MKQWDYIILGGGLSGLMLAAKMAEDDYFQDKRILLLEHEEKNTNDRTWCFWEKGSSRWDALVHHTWSHLEVHGDGGPSKKDIHPYTYKMIQSKTYYAHMHRILEQASCITQVQAKVIGYQKAGDIYEVKTEENSYQGEYLFNSIFNPKELQNQSKYPLILQHFYGEVIQLNQETLDPTTAKFMDFSLDQKGDTRFMYFLPMSANKVLVEYTVFSKTMLPKEAYKAEVKDYLERHGMKEYRVEEEEFGVIPMTCFPFFKKNDHRLLHIGTAGGWTKPSTGFTFMFSDNYTDAALERIKSGMSFQTFLGKTRFWRYDLWLLDIFNRRPDFGKSFFSQLFEQHEIQDILAFLDQETHFGTELKIMAKSPRWPFIRSVLGNFGSLI